MVNTRKFNYNETVYRHTLISDIDRNIPSIKVINKNKYALIIGNEGYANKYTGLSKNFNVPYTRNDALIFKEYAVKMLGVPEKNITLLLDAGKNEMYESILTLSKQVRDLAGKGQLVFYYAGHGLADTIPTRRAPYLMPVDIPPSEIEDAISMEFLYTKIWESKSLKSIVFIDASFNNGGRNMGLRGPSAQIVNPRTELISGNTVVFSATTENHTANVFHDKKHGLFTYFLLKALKETRGNINLHKLYNSVKTNVEKKASALGKHQTPITLNSTAVDEMWQEWKVQ
ncbi:MAG: hypothetical protein B6I20_13355 [Bacteroidetes bacterium 4572_117]|nr:MAG: hypothetical protein B6I20_13355 [Bacteroidetes bacterium 4572_117]